MPNKIFKSIICLAILICLAGIVRTYAQDGEELRRYIRRAQTAYSSGNYSNALEEYQKALKLAPNYPELYKAIGDVHEKLGSTANLNAAIEHYKRYLELAPNAADARQIRDKIYDLEYLSDEQEKQDRILDDLSGEWVAIDSINITKKEEDGRLRFTSNFIFQIAEIQKTGKYRVTMEPQGSRYYSDNLIEKTVHVVPAKDNAFTFTFADATVYTPESGKYNYGRFLGRAIGTAAGKDWIGELADIAMTAAQERDLPNNTQTAYTFALRYEEGRLVGLINVVGKFSDPTRQQTTVNETYEITFVKKDDRLDDMLRTMIEGNPDVLNPIKGAFTATFKDKWGKRLSNKETVGKLHAFDLQLEKQYHKAKNMETIGLIMFGVGLSGILPSTILISDNKNQNMGIVIGVSTVLLSITSGIVFQSSYFKKVRIVNQYNKQIMQHTNKPTAELRFGITSSGGVGLALIF